MKRSKNYVLPIVIQMVCGVNLAFAGPTIEYGDNKESSITVGAGVQGSYTNTDAAVNNTKNSFAVGSARIYLSGNLNKSISGMLNFDAKAPTPTGGTGEVIDANIQFKINPNYTVWAGRFLSPSDRANMAGPFYSLGGGYWSSVASRYGYNGGHIGRDDGVAIEGSALDGMLQFGFGAFNGHTAFNLSGAPAGYTGSSLASTYQPMYSGRIQIDFWDAEPGLLYGTGNYLGAKDILAIGIASRAQKGGATGSIVVGDYKSNSVDFLLEKKGVGPGAISFEAAYYTYDTDGAVLTEQGKAYSAAMGYIFNQKVGSGDLSGQFQPFIRYQQFKDEETTSLQTKKYDLGVDYIMKGYNARIAAFYSDTQISQTAKTTSKAFTVTATVQF